MLNFKLFSAVGVALLLICGVSQTAFAGAGGSTGEGFGVSVGDANGLLSIVDPTREENAANYVYSLFGGQNDTLVVGDWNGDGTKTLGVTQELNGALLWIRDFTGNGSLVYDLFGSAGDIPTVGDWDPNAAGDEIGFARPNMGDDTLEWILRDNTPGTGFSREFFGAAADTPVPGNWDSDANNGDELGVTQDVVGAPALLWITQGSGGIDYNLFGANGDTPVQGDYTGDGNTNFGVSTPGSNLFVLDGAAIEYHIFGAASNDPFRSDTFGQP